MSRLAIYALGRPQGLVGSITLMMLATLLVGVPRYAAQALRKGVHVEMAVTQNAVAMPDADKADAIVVAVTHDGSVYLGVDPITPAALAEKHDQFSRAEEKLYIKGDARTPYADVAKVLDAVRAAGVTDPNLLTNQRETPAPGKIVPPKGLEVLIGPPLPSGAEPTVLQVVNSTQEGPLLKINNRDVPWTNLEGSLRQLLQNRSEKVVLLKADGGLAYTQVVHVIDACRAAGAKVFLVTPAT
jgi:biopolymer transport protein ExbD